MRPACTNCNKEMEQTTTGVTVGLIIKGGQLYQVWHGDEYTCKDCKARVVARYGQGPVWAQHMAGHTPAPKVDRMVIAL